MKIDLKARRYLQYLSSHKLVWLLFVPIVLLVTAVATVYWANRSTVAAEEDLRRTLRVMSQIHAIHALTAEAASGVRGFLLTDDPSFLQSYWRAQSKLDEALSLLHHDVRDETQKKYFGQISVLLNREMKELADLQSHSKDFNRDKLLDQLIENKALLDQLRQLITEMQEHKQTLIQRRIIIAQQVRNRNLWVTSFALLLVLMVTTGLGVLVLRVQESQQALVLAESANRAKTDFLSRISHELRTPLNGILGFAQVLEYELAGLPAQRSVDAILTSGRHLLHLVNEVIDISRIESGALRLEMKPLLLNSVLQEAMDIVQPTAAAKKITLRIQNPKEANVYADRQRVLQILLNLIGNAIKFNRLDGRVEVEISLHQGLWKVSVRDTGMGIAPENCAKLFTPFERLETNHIEGTGLGLAVSKSLVEAMKGQIDFESTPGQGSLFWFTLPVAEDVLQPANTTTAQPKPQTATAAGKRILYIEDNHANQILVETLVARRPAWHLGLAETGSAGLYAATNAPIDLVLLDLGLPDMGGEEVLTQLKAQHPQLPVVILSADALPATIQRLKALGALDYLVKPLEVNHFFKLLDSIL